MDEKWGRCELWKYAWTASFPVVLVWIAVMDSLHLNHWPKCCRQALGPLYNFSGKLLFFTAFIMSEFGDGASCPWGNQVLWFHCLWSVVSKTKTEARSTHISKTKHPKLENEAPKTRQRSTQNSKTKHPCKNRKRSTQNSKPFCPLKTRDSVRPLSSHQC